MLWIKAFHIITMVTWFAGLFYLPRLFVYHAELENDESKSHERFCIMERRLYWGIMTPSAILTLSFGLYLTHLIGDGIYFKSLWMHAKLTLVLVLVLYHVYCWRALRSFRLNKNKHSSLFYRWFNEFPAVILVAVVLLVILKPS